MIKQTLGICHGPRCADYGGIALLKCLHQRGVTAEILTCQSLCSYSPVVKFNDEAILHASLQAVLAKQKQKQNNKVKI